MPGSNRPRLVVVGEAPNKSGQTLARHPDCHSRKRLRNLGLPDDVRFTNILPEWPGATGKGSKFPSRKDLESTQAIIRLHRRFPMATKYLFLGRRGAFAYGLDSSVPLLTWVRPDWCVRECAILPHPSGVNHFWNEEENTAAAMEFIVGMLGG